MGIPVLLNPFGAERSTRQRLLNAVQKTDDYIMSQKVLHNDSLNTCNQDTALFPIEECPMLCICLYVNTLLQVEGTRHCHTSVSLWKRSPRVVLASACWIRRSHPNLISWYPAEIHSKEDMRGDRIWQPLCYTENCPWLPKMTKRSQ